jgi:hypothetical protein
VQVLHPRLLRRELASVVGKPGSALVEQDQSQRTSEAEVEVAPGRILPPIEEIRDVVRNVNKVDSAIAYHLEGKRDTTAPCVLDLRAGQVQLHRIIVGDSSLLDETKHMSRQSSRSCTCRFVSRPSRKRRQGSHRETGAAAGASAHLAESPGRP